MTGLKYGTKDTLNMLDALYKLNDAEKSAEEIVEAIGELSKYPIEVVEKFLMAVNAINEKLIIPENKMGIIAYITIRINL